jgi:hypothetical protein
MNKMINRTIPAIEITEFPKGRVLDFLSAMGYGNAANTFAETLGTLGSLDDLQLEEWMRDYFPTERAHMLFVMLKCEMAREKSSQ